MHGKTQEERDREGRPVNAPTVRPVKRLYYTVFADQYARYQLRCSAEDLTELATQILSIVRGAKAELPWIKLARFGDAASDKGCLRHDLNVDWISGIECDIDDAR